MDKKPNLLGRIIKRLTGPQIQEVVEGEIKKELDKAQGGDAIRFSPSLLPSPDGSMRKPYPLGVSFQTLRDFADFYPIARAAVEYRKSQITHLEWNIVPTELNNETITNKKNTEDAKELRERLRYPTGKKDSSMTNWLKQILEDLLVIDA